MTKEIQSIARQVLEQSVSLPRDTGASDLQGAFRELGKLGTQVATDFAVEKASQKGAAEGLLGPKKLAPGIGAATKAYNDSFLNAQSSNVALNTKAQMQSEAMRLTSPGTLSSSSFGEWEAISQSIVRGALEGVNPEIQPQVALKLHDIKNQMDNSVSSTVMRFNQQRTAEVTQDNFNSGISEMRFSILSGDEDRRERAKSQVLQSIDDAVNLSGISPTQAQEMRDRYNQALINGSLEKQYLSNLSESGELGAETFIGQFINTPMRGISDEQKEKSKSFLLDLHTKTVKELNILSSAGLDEINKQMILNPESFQTVEDIDRAAEEQAVTGSPLSQGQINNLYSKVIRGQKGQSKEAVTNARISSAIQSDSILDGDFTSSELNNYYDTMLMAAMEKDAAASAEDGRDPLPRWMVEAMVVEGIPVEVPKFTKNLSSRLTNAAMNDFDAATRQYNFLSSRNPQAVAGLDPKVDALASSLTAKILNAPAGANINALYEEAKDAAFNMDEDVKRNRAKNLSDWRTKHKNENMKDVGEAFGYGRPFFSKPEIDDYMVAEYNRRLDFNASIFGVADLDLAREKTIKELKGLYDFDPGYGPGNRPVPNPVSKLPYIDAGFTVNNQVVNSIKQVIDSQEGFESELPATFRWSEKMGDVPSNPTEEQRYEENYGKDGFWVDVNTTGMGKDEFVSCKVYPISPNVGTSDFFSPDSYQLFYGWRGVDGKDKEVLRPIKTMQDAQNLFNKDAKSLNIQMMRFAPPDEYVPNYIKEVNKRDTESLLARSAKEQSKTTFEDLFRADKQKDKPLADIFEFRIRKSDKPFIDFDDFVTSDVDLFSMDNFKKKKKDLSDIEKRLAKDLAERESKDGRE